MDSFLTILFIIILFFFSGGVIFFLSKKSKLDEKQSEAIKELNNKINEIKGKLEAIGNSVSGSSKTMLDQVSSFTKETTQVRENLKKIQEEMKNISSFQEIFKTPKLRGEWGEASLEHLLSEYLPSELYIINHKFSTGDEIEAVLKLPNKRLLPIDAKFFSDNFEKMIQAKTEEERDVIFTGKLYCKPMSLISYSYKHRL